MKFLFLVLLLIGFQVQASEELYNTRPTTSKVKQWDALQGELTTTVSSTVTFPQSATIEEVAFDAYFQTIYPYDVYPGAPLEMTVRSGSWSTPTIEFTPTEGHTGYYPVYFFVRDPLEVTAGVPVSLSVSFDAIFPTSQGIYPETGFYLDSAGNLAMEAWGTVDTSSSVVTPESTLLILLICFPLICRSGDARFL